jgi:hypothetical protein
VSRTAAPTVCTHGRAGYCHDAATAEERAAFDGLHRHAYEWALPIGRDEAEAYAAAYAAAYFDAPDDAPRHSWDALAKLVV